jgi:membrane protease YdiL (CAAX protease family)
MRPSATLVRPATFFVLTYVLSWLIWIPLVLSHFGIGGLAIAEGTSSLVRLFGVLMPATAALLLTARAGGRAAVRSLLGQLKVWRVGWQWWGAAVVVQPVLLVLAALIYNRLGGDPQVTPVAAGSAVVLLVNVIFLLLATLGEEIGWRGLALPALQLKRSPLAASVILGLVWAVWHVPFWLLMDTFDQFGVGYILLNLLLLPLAFYITWLYNGSRSSLLLVVALHLSFNIVNVAWLPVTSNVGAFGVFLILEWLVALALVPRLKRARS